MKLQEFMSPIINHVIKYVIISLNVNCTIVYSEQFFFLYAIFGLYVTKYESCYMVCYH